jgi:hypothetical protein
MKRFAYDSPLEVEDDVELDPTIIDVNGMKFQRRSDCNYFLDYEKLVQQASYFDTLTRDERLANPQMNSLNVYRNLIQQDLWFFVYFLMKNPLANHPFIFESFKEVQF